VISHHFVGAGAVRRDWAWNGVVFVALGIFYAPAILAGAYLYADDYAFRQVAQQGAFGWFFSIFTQMGRPLTGVYSKIVYENLETVAVYGWVRAFGLAGTIAFALYGFRLARRANWNAPMAALGIIALTTNPGWAVWVGWPACTIYPWGALAALVAGEWLISARSSWQWLGAVILGAISVCIYQLATTALVLPVLFRIARRKESEGAQRFGEVALTGAFLGILYVANLAFMRLLKPFFEKPFLSRDGVVQDYAARFNQFFDDLLPRHFDGWFATFEDPMASMPLLLLALALFTVPTHLREGRSWSRIFGLVATSFSLFGLSLVPLAGVGEDYLPWRILTISMGTLTLVFLLPFAREMPHHRELHLGRIAISAWLVGQILAGAFAFREGLVAPNVREVSGWRNELERQFEERPSHFTYLEPERRKDELSGMRDSFEYGRGSGSYVWMGQFLVNTLFDEIFPESPRGETASTTLPEHLRDYLEPCPTLIEGWRVTSPNHPPEARPIKKTREHPLLGELKVIQHYWTAGWMGAFDYEQWPRLYHASFGWICLEEFRSRPQVIWFEAEDGNHFGLRPERWPQVYWEEGKVWLDPCDYFTVLKLEAAD
jgi:hypothetical protein